MMMHGGGGEKIAPLFFVVGFVESANVLRRDILSGAGAVGAKDPVISRRIVLGMGNEISHDLPAGARKNTIDDFRLAHDILGVRISFDEAELGDSLIGFHEHLLIDELSAGCEAVQESA